MTVINPNEVELNSKFYPIIGPVRPRLASRFPGKVVTGDYTKDSEVIASSWVIDDLRGGVLREELSDETDRCWWNTCDHRFAKEITLGQTATSITAPVPAEPVAVNADCELETGWTNGSRSGARAQGGSYSWGNISSTPTYQDITNFYRGAPYTFSMYVWAGGGTAGHITIDDGVSSTSSGAATAGAWTLLTVTRTLSLAATRLRISITELSTVSTIFADTATITRGTSVVGNPNYPTNFNSNLYVAFGRWIAKLNATGDAWTLLAYMPATITGLIPTVNSTMIIALGDSTNYVYMNTSEEFAQADVSGVDKGVTWGSLFYAINTSGQMKYAATPNATSPAFTNNAVLPLDARPARELFLGRDASGTEIIYASSNIGLYAHDHANTQFLSTDLTIPSHPNGGKGACRWRDSLYMPTGLTVYKYYAGSTATIQNVGLDKDDGLPTEYNGEIISLVPGHQCLYALVDATQTSGTTTSSILTYDGGGWGVLYTAASTETTMTTGVESTVYAYRFYFISNNVINYIPLFRGFTKPKRDTSHVYASSGVIITPWFTANTPWYKTAIRVKVQADDTSSTETIVIKYRTDYSNLTVASGWTTLGTVNTDGETILSLGSSAGVAFKSIQFRIELARGSTNTTSPVLKWAALTFVHDLPAAYGWLATLNLTEDYRGRSIVTMWDDIESIINGNVLVPFTFASDRGGKETHYVRISALSGEQHAQEKKSGIFTVELLAP